MARIRTIKPEFFTSEDIVGLSAYARLLYVALWCEADREGRLTWKPGTFKIRYLPADSVKIENLCEELVSRGLVILYGHGLAWIPKFSDHQHVNPRESQSILPSPPNASGTRRHASARDSDAQVGREGKGREGKEKEGEEQPSASSTSGEADPQLFPGGKKSDPDKKAAKVQRLREVTLDAIHSFNASPLTKAQGGNLPSVNGKLPSAIETRMAQVKRVIKLASEIAAETSETKSTQITKEFWEDYWAAISEDNFMSGRGTPSNGHENWKPDFEFLTRQKTMLKVFDRASEAE